MARNGDSGGETTYKILVLGDSAVGKTCLIYRYCDRAFHEHYISTIGIDCKEKVVHLDGQRIRLRIWDTAGQERFRTLTTAYYRGAHGILLVYDLTNVDTFNHLTYWLKNIELMAPENIGRVLVANKCDRTWCRQVDEERGNKLADSFGVTFFETSGKSGANVDEAFEALARNIRQAQEKKKLPPVTLNPLYATSSDDGEHLKSSRCGC